MGLSLGHATHGIEASRHVSWQTVRVSVSSIWYYFHVFGLFSGLQAAVTNYNRVLEEIKTRLKSANASRYIV
jgi:hypothetical protein